MKKLFVFSLMWFVFTGVSFSQHFGLKGGLDLLNVKYVYQGEDEKANVQMGFHLGMAAEINLSRNIALGSGLIFAEKGFKEDYQLSGKDKTTFFYLEMPLLLILKGQLLQQGIYLFGGTYFDYGLFTNLTGSGFVIDKGFGGLPQQYQKFDMGLKIGGGITLNVFRIGLEYSHGWSDIRNADDTSVKNRVLGINVIYFL